MNYLYIFKSIEIYVGNMLSRFSVHLIHFGWISIVKRLWSFKRDVYIQKQPVMRGCLWHTHKKEGASFTKYKYSDAIDVEKKRT